MNCKDCGSIGKVTIGSKDYCSNCGNMLEGNPPLSEGPALTPVTVPAPDQALPSSPANPGMPTPPSTVAIPQISEIKIDPPDTNHVNTADRYHASGVKSTNVLDLRQLDQPKSLAEAPPAGSALAPSANPQPPPSVGQTNMLRKTQRESNAVNVAKSPQISNFKRERPAEELVPPPPVKPVALPNETATAHQAMQNLVVHGGSRLPSTEVTTQALSTEIRGRPKAVSMAAAVAALALVSGYVWVTNYPKMAIRLAAAKAGFQASLPGYIPANYSLAGPVDYSPGRLSINYQSPGGQPITITQQRTDWDSKSLLDNFISRQSSEYTAFQGQGLTIYLYNGNQAAWVNHGIWYSITGADKLGRDQLLKIAYNL